MRHKVELIPLNCFQCGTPIPAEPDEIAWVCVTCGHGLQLDDEDGLLSLDIHFAQSISAGMSMWLPFWVAKGKVSITQRETAMKDDFRAPLWREEQTFFVPAFDCTLGQAVDWGTYLLRYPLQLVEGPTAEMEKVTLDKKDMRALAEFIVLSIEAERKDLLTNIEIKLDLEEPELWVLPVQDKDGTLHLRINRKDDTM